MTNETVLVRSFGLLYHRWWDTQPRQSQGLIEEEWRIGPFQLVRHYPRGAKEYGDWNLYFMLAWRGWRGPWFTFAFGSGAQNWDRDEEWWKDDAAAGAGS